MMEIEFSKQRFKSSEIKENVNSVFAGECASLCEKKCITKQSRLEHSVCIPFKFY